MSSSRWIAGLLACAACARAAPPPTAAAPAPPAPSARVTTPAKIPGEAVDLGDVTVIISGSRTAAVFHAVDQLSAWSPYSHMQYMAWWPPPHSSDDDALLAQHRAIRKRLKYEGGLEKAFYLTASAPRDAVLAARTNGVLTGDEAEHEAVVLETWSKKLDAELSSQKAVEDVTAALRGQVPAFQRLAQRWLAIADLPRPQEPFPFVVVPTPGQGLGGGGANGGVLVIEVPANGARATLTTVGHELIHMLLHPKWGHFVSAAQKCGKPKVDATALSESIVYAMAPGLFAYDAGVGSLEQIEASHRGSDHPYALFSRTALALRPTVGKMLQRAEAGERGMLDELLDAACAAAK